MSVTTRLLLFGAALIALFAGAAGIGRAVGPVESTPSADHGDMAEDADDEAAGMDVGDVDATALPKGLMVTQNGYTFRLASPQPQPAMPYPWRSRSKVPTATR